MTKTKEHTSEHLTTGDAKAIGKDLWRKARVKRFLGEPKRTHRFVAQSLAAYIDERIEHLKEQGLPDPLPRIGDTYPADIVWGERTWDLPVSPDEVRDTPARKSPHVPRYEMGKEGETRWIDTYRAVEAALTHGLYSVGRGHFTRSMGEDVTVVDDPYSDPPLTLTLDPDVIAVCSARPLDEDEDGRVRSYLADVVDAVLVRIHRNAVDRRIEHIQHLCRHDDITPAIDRTTGELQNADALASV